MSAPLTGLRPPATTTGPPSYWDGLGQDKKLGSIDSKRSRKLGRQTGWSPGGAVREYWQKEVFPSIREVMHDKKNKDQIYGHHSSKQPACSFRLFMVGFSPLWENARPTIIASCTIKKFAKNTIELLQKFEPLKRSTLGFDFLALEDKIVLTADQGSDEFMQHEFTDSGHTSLCGAKIVISPNPSSGRQHWTHATLGGVITVNGRYYGLTAAHAFFDDLPLEDHGSFGSDHSSNNADHTSDEDDQTEDGNVLTGEMLDLDSPNEKEADGETQKFTRRSIYLDSRPARNSSARGASRIVQNPEETLSTENLIGTVETDGKSGDQRSVSSRISRDNDWALFEIISPRFHGPNEIKTPSGDTLSVYGISEADPNGSVMVAAGVTGVSETESSGLISGIILPNSRTMLDAWIVQQSSLPGDCGAWVLDSRSGNVFAMVVASSRKSQESYCIPMTRIINSILSLQPVGATISFPGGDDIAYNATVYHKAALASVSEWNDSNDSDLGSNHPSQRDDAPTQTTVSDELNKTTHGPDVEEVPDSPRSADAGPAWQHDQTATSADRISPVPPKSAVNPADDGSKQTLGDQTRWTRVRRKDFPPAVLDVFHIPWWRHEGDSDYIMIDKEAARVVDKEWGKSRRRTKKKAIRPRVSTAFGGKLDYETKSKHDEDVNGGSAFGSARPASVASEPHAPIASQEPARIASPKVIRAIAETRAPGVLEKNFTLIDETGIATGAEDLIEEIEEEGEKGNPFPHRGVTRIPRRLVHDKVLHDLGYLYYEEGNMLVIEKAIGGDAIDKIRTMTKEFRDQEQKAGRRHSGPSEFVVQPMPDRTIRQLVEQQYDRQFDEIVRTIFQHGDLPEKSARTLLEQHEENEERKRIAVRALGGHDGTLEEIRLRLEKLKVYEKELVRRNEESKSRRNNIALQLNLLSERVEEINKEDASRKHLSEPYEEIAEMGRTGGYDEDDQKYKERVMRDFMAAGYSRESINAILNPVIKPARERTVVSRYGDDTPGISRRFPSPDRPFPTPRRPIGNRESVYFPSSRRRSPSPERGRYVEREVIIRRDSPPPPPPRRERERIYDREEIIIRRDSPPPPRPPPRREFERDFERDENIIRKESPPPPPLPLTPRTVMRRERQIEIEEPIDIRIRERDRDTRSRERERERDIDREEIIIRRRSPSPERDRTLPPRERERERERDRDRDRYDEEERWSRYDRKPPPRPIHGEYNRESDWSAPRAPPVRPTYIRVNRSLITPATLEHFMLPWEWDSHDINYILIKKPISRDFHDHLVEYTLSTRNSRFLKDRAENREDDLDNIIRRARSTMAAPDSKTGEVVRYQGYDF